MTWTAFRQSMMRHPLDVTASALYVARLVAYPDLDVDEYIGEINQIADEVLDSDVMNAPRQ